jgi:hypothetical protein
MEQVKQTAVEWLESEFIKLESTIGVYGIMYKLIEQAKEMEKQEIINTYRDGRSDQQSEKPSRFYNRWAELYYNEQYGK